MVQELTEDVSELLGAANKKWNARLYGQRYQQYFAPLRNKELKILEIGIGGYDDPASGGESLRVWKRYFPNSMVYGIDIVNKQALEEDRIKTFQGGQDDEAFLRKVVAETGKLDIIIDDGSHRNDHVIKSFKLLFPELNEGGIYVVEDTHFSYVPSSKNWPGNGEPPRWAQYGGSLDLYERNTMINFFKRLVDCMSHQEFIHPGYQPNYFDLNIVGVHFYRGQIFVLKGDNTGPGNFCENNVIRPQWLKAMGIGSMDELGLEYPDVDDPTRL